MRLAGKCLARVSIVMLALFSTGLTYGVAEVESRSSSGAWGSQDHASSEGSTLDLIKKIEYLQQEMQELRGKVEEQAYTIQQLQASQKKIYVDLDSRIGQGAGSAHHVKSDNSGVSLDLDGDETLEAPPTTGTLNLDNNAAQPVMSTLSATTASPEAIIAEERAYQQAYRLIQRKDHDGAVIAFQALNKQYPQGKYLPNANYWLGEIYLTKNQFDLAAQAFESVYRGYPTHPKAADALLKMGYVAYGQGDYKRAESIFNQVKSKYANSTSSQLADAKLSRMQHEGQI